MGKGKSGKKLCVICSCFGDNDDDFKIFILDLVHGGKGEGEGEVPLVTETETVPNFRIQNKRRLSFCILNSAIYMFDYAIIRDNEDEERERLSGYDRNCVYKYCLEEDSKTQNIYLEKSMMDKVESMLTPKRGARAIPTPDGRIVCHSTQISIVMVEDEDDESYVVDNKFVHFEIYDPGTDSWAQLPAPELRVSSGYDDLQIKDVRTKAWKSLPINPPRLWKLTYFTLGRSFFISKHELVVLIRMHIGGGGEVRRDDFELFVSLDIVSPSDQGWKLHGSGWLNPHALFFSPFLVVEDRLSLSCRHGYAKDRDDKSGVQIEHQLSEMPVLGSPHGTNIAVVDYRPNQECSFYGVRSRGTDTRDSYLVIDFFKYSLPTRNKKKLKKKKMVAATPQFHHINSFRFRIPEPDMYFCVLTASVLPRTIFPFPT